MGIEDRQRIQPRIRRRRLNSAAKLGRFERFKRTGIRCLITLLATCLTFFSVFANAGEPYQFSSADYLGDASLMPDWADTMNRETNQSVLLDACLDDAESCPAYYRGLRHLLRRAEALPQRKQISLISRYVNRKRYRNDRTARLDSPLSGQTLKYRSRWATVEEFMRRGGDCEDYATTKYYLLRRLGFSVDQLRIVVAWDQGQRGYHAVLAVRLPDPDRPEILLLESDDSIKRGSRHRYRFIYSMNEQSIWDHEADHASAARIKPASLNKETSA